MKSYFVITILLAIISVGYANAQPARKPNVIFIVADDIGYDVPTVNGGQSFSTPNIDSMVRHGMNFTHCESSPLCNPSRTMLLTGKQNYRNYSAWGYLSDTAKTVGNMMKDAGYNTAYYGKLQLELDTNSLQQMSDWGWNKFTVFEIKDDTLPNTNRYKSPNLVDNNGRVAGSITKDHYCDDILTQRITDFIDSNKSKPFFVYYSMSLCHKPFCPTPDDPQYISWDPSKGVSDTFYFSSMVKYMDKKVGEILHKLRSVGLDTNTLVLYVGDNGTPHDIYYHANNKRVQGGKTQTNEAGTHVPMIAYLPKFIAPNSKNDDLIDFTDFFSTFAAIGRNRNLNRYGTVDGTSFYNRLFNKQGDSVRSFIFSHYAPYFSVWQDTLRRWIRDKQYKLYDSTGVQANDGKFYNIVKDPYERSPIPAVNLTSAESVRKTSFKKILNTTANWAKAPFLNNASVSNITSTSATLSATIVNSGATPLRERGSDLSNVDKAYYLNNSKKDLITGPGSFSHQRTKLNPQTKYYYSLYAMNQNASHSMGYVWGTFFTFSNPPLKQPTQLTTAARPCAVQLSWNNAGFPAKGANKAGYLVYYSTKSIVLNQSAKGHPPSFVTTDPTTRSVNIESTLPSLPAATATISGLSPDTLYYFTVVPYTWNGKNDSTYNYLLAGALTTSKKPLSCTLRYFETTDSTDGSLSPEITVGPNPSKSRFTLTLKSIVPEEIISLRVIDNTGRVYYNKQISGQQEYSFGEELPPGIYFLYLNTPGQNFVVKIIKE